MHLTEFHVVLVDDEPDVHEITRLALRKFRVYGLPIRLHSAASKAEGIELMNSLTLGRADISLASVALIDVVMETDHAGLELCAYIRDVMKNRRMQLYVRTGQPGVAPERSVIDQYDIQGYLAKSEATEDKLYTLVKAGVRQACYTGLSHALQDLLHCLIQSASSRDKIAEAMRGWQRQARLNLKGETAVSITSALCYLVDDQFVAGVDVWHDQALARQRRDELVALPATPLSDDGDCYMMDGRDLLIQIAPTAANAAVQYMLRGTVASPDFEISLYHAYLRSFAALWKQAG
jgi:CheY-like chemotaxis protein